MRFLLGRYYLLPNKSYHSKTTNGRNNILDADIFFEKFKNKKLKENEVCLTFDDTIKCQIDIALPVLEEFKIKSFFFVYTSVFEGRPDNLEVFRYFRMNFFDNVDEFYNNFYKVLDKDLRNFFDTNNEKIKSTKVKFPHYFGTVKSFKRFLEQTSSITSIALSGRNLSLI